MKMPKKHIVIAVVGLTPQVVTETLYALLMRQEEPVIPFAIYLITTSEGKKKAIQELIDDGKGQFYKFCSEYGIDASRIAFDESTIHTVRDRENRQLEDIRNTDDNEAIADFIVNFVREKTTDNDTVIHASAAGGRKTMGIYLSNALSLFGRVQDKLYHVLVNPSELENHPGFFYVPKQKCLLELPGGAELDAAAANIELAEVPYIRLQEKLDRLDFDHSLSYNEMVVRSQGEIDLLEPIPEVEIDDSAYSISINNAEIILRPLDHAVYRTFIQQKTDFCTRKELARCGECTDCFMDMQGMLEAQYHDRVFKWYEELKALDDERLSRSKEAAGDHSWHREKMAHINKEIHTQLRNRQIERYCSVSPDRKTQGKRYGLFIDKNKIHVI
ncbi:CRISPR-associated ring nuclease Csm6 [candidate division KSB1 bacterium]